MKKILVGMVLMVFCLSLSTTFAARGKMPARDKMPAAGMRPVVTDRIELPDGMHVLVFQIPLERYGGGATEDGYPFAVTTIYDEIRIRIVGDDYDSGFSSPDLTTTDDRSIGHYSRILKTGSYTYTLNARRSVYYNEAFQGSETVTISGSLTLRSNSTVIINWIEGELTPIPTPFSPDSGSGTMDMPARDFTTTTTIRRFDYVSPTTTTTTIRKFDSRRFR